MPDAFCLPNSITLRSRSHRQGVAAAKALGAEVHILVAGHNCKAVADAAAKLDGVKKVLLADARDL